MWFIMTEKDILDYITNIQQENERLKDTIEWWKDRFFGQQEYDDSHRITAIEYRKRLYKVFEYVKNRKEEFKNAGKSRKYIKSNHYYMLLLDLLNILQNRSDSQ